MEVVMLYRPRSEHEGMVLDYIHDYERFKGKKIQMINLDDIDGATLAELHDITKYPAILALASDGSAQKIWQGLPLPLMNELDPYAAEFHAKAAKLQTP